MYVGIWCVYEEIWLKMMTMGEWNDAKMDGFINKIMKNWRLNIPPHWRFCMSSCKQSITKFHNPTDSLCSFILSF